MRAVVAMMKHETNTFSPVATPLERFGRLDCLYGPAAADFYRGSNTALAAYLDLLEAAGAEIAVPVAASASPSGRVPEAVYEHLSGCILGAVAKGCDALFLDLHGAMVAETTDDGEGTLLERLRGLAPGLPIAVALDLHTNLTQRMIDHADVLCGYRTYPHIDIYDTGRRAGSILLRKLAGELSPKLGWGHRPMLPHTLKMGHDEQPMQHLQEMAAAAEAGGLLDVSVFGGFPMADIDAPGLSVIAIADGDAQAAQATADRILDAGWERRRAFVYEAPPLAHSIAQAKAQAAGAKGPVLLIDHADNCASGGTQDTVAVLREVLAQGLEDVAMFAICDPAAVAILVAAGPGAEVTLPLGGKIDMPAIGKVGEPITLTGRVRAITDGEFTVTGPMFTGTRASMGRSVLFDIGPVQIAVIEENHEPFDLGCLRSLGVEPTAKRFILLKSRIHYRAGFKPIAGGIVECDGIGVTSSDYSLFKFERLARPAYPLDSYPLNQ